MNKPTTVKVPATNEMALARRVLTQWPQIRLETAPRPEIDLVDGRYPLAIEVKRTVNGGNVWQLTHNLLRGNAVALVVGEVITASAQGVLRDHGINYADSVGNAHLDLPGLYVHVEGKSMSEPRYPARLQGKAAVVAQALLLDLTRAWKVQDLAATALVSPALAHRVFRRLEDAGFVASVGRGPGKLRHLKNPSGLLDTLASEIEPARATLAGYRLARSGSEAARATREALVIADIPSAVTGAVAAEALTPSVTATPTAELWVSDRVTLAHAATIAKLKPAAQGANVILRQSRSDTALAFADEERGVANWVRVYVDLLADPRRGAEQAAAVRRHAGV